MSNWDFLKPLAARIPKIMREAGKIIDAHGDGDGSVDISDVVDTVKEAASNVVEAISDILE